MNACEVKAHLIGYWQNLSAVCFWVPILSGLNLFVAALLRDSLCVVSLLPCMADCCMLYTVCKVGRFTFFAPPFKTAPRSKSSTIQRDEVVFYILFTL